MEVVALSQGSGIQEFQQTAVQSSVQNSTRLDLRTREGDIVELSFGQQSRFAQSSTYLQNEEGSTIQQFTAESQAAFEYSLSIQGDLNEDELSAIQDLANRIRPIASQFFRGGEVDLEASAQSLGESLGVIQEIELELQQTVVQKFSSRSFSTTPASAEFPNDKASPPSIDPGGVRDLGSLVSAVVKNVFEEQMETTASNKTALQTLKDLHSLLRERLLKFFNPLQSENLPQTGGLDPAPENATETATEV